MKKLTSLLMFVGLAFNVSGQEEPKNLKEAMDASKARWLIGNWESENTDRENSQKQYKWGIEDSVILVHSKSRREYHGVIGFDVTSGKVIAKYFDSGNGVRDSEWLPYDGGKLIEIVKGSRVQDGELQQFSYARIVKRIDDNTFEMSIHQVLDSGEIGEVAKNQTTGAAVPLATYRRKK